MSMRMAMGMVRVVMKMVRVVMNMVMMMVMMSVTSPPSQARENSAMKGMAERTWRRRWWWG